MKNILLTKWSPSLIIPCILMNHKALYKSWEFVLENRRTQIYYTLKIFCLEAKNEKCKI